MNLLLAGTIGELLDKIFAGFDMAVFSFFGNIQCGFLTAIAKIFTAMGSTKYVAMIGVLALVLCFFRRTRKVGIALVFAIIIGTLITNIVVKPMFLRVRPYNTLQNIPEYWRWYLGAGSLCESDYCFPSGHTTGAFEIATVLCLMYATTKKKKIAWIFPVIALLTAASRVYLMVHYVTDVLAGFIVGTFAGIMGFLISRAICKALKRRPIDKKVDLAKLFKKGYSRKAAELTLFIVWLLIFGVSYVTSIGDGGPDTIRCAYSGDYDCQNEAQVDSKKYPAIDGKAYCKIHWKELSREFAETGVITSSSKEEPEDNKPVLNAGLFAFYHDPAITAFQENFAAAKPVKMRYYRAGQADEMITDPQIIQQAFDALSKVQITEEDTSGLMVSDSSLSITFYMEDETAYTFGFETPGQINFQGKYYVATGTDDIYHLNLNVEPAQEPAPEPEEEWEEDDDAA